MSLRSSAWLALGLAGGLALVACSDAPPSTTYFQREIQPILRTMCLNGGGGACHTDDGTGRANGNLDLSTFASIKKRHDVLERFGSYPAPLLLLKALGSNSQQLTMQMGDVSDIPLNINHAGGPILYPSSDAYFTLSNWLYNGATENGMPPVKPPLPYDRGACSPDIRTDLFAQPTIDAVDTSSPQYKTFISDVWPIIKGGVAADGTDWGPGCLGAECHGVRDTNKVPTIELYFTCGDDDQQRRFNYLMARTYIGAGGRGQLSEKALIGGGSHAGGKHFGSVDDPHYRAIVDWSAMDTPFELAAGEGERFFTHNVQPVLAARGCYMQACHSLVNFNFYKPLAGTDGLIGTRTALHNYLQARFMLGLESPDPAQGRLIKKNLLPTEGGIFHRGGPLLGSIAGCDLDIDAIRADPTRRWFDETRPGCVVAAWHQLERRIAEENLELLPDPGAVGVFVRRPANPDRLIDFDTYRPGADLLRMDLTLDGNGRVTGLAGTPTSLLGSCGVNVADADVRRPDISGDGQKVVFAMRTSAAEGLDLWQVNIDGSGCARLGLSRGSDSTGTPIHHFDPKYGPGGVIAFASSMGDPSHVDPARRYPSRTPKYFLPNSNIWVFAPGGAPQKLSYLNGAELTPGFLHTREVVYAVEKAAPDFYQISTRAVRLDDGGGYRPQLGQRTTMGFGQVTELRELIDFRTVFIGSYPGSYFGGGSLGVQDLSLGLEELSLQDAGFPHPIKVLDPDAASMPGVAGTGVYRSPTPLPDGRILVAYSPGSVDLGNPSSSVDYGLWVVDPQGREAPWQLYDSPGMFDIEPVVAYKRIWVPQPNRVHQGDPLRGEYVFHSIPLFAPLLNNNTRMSTIPNNDVAGIRVLEQLPPPDGTTSAADVSGDLYGVEQVYVKRRLIGEAPLLPDGSVRILVPSRTPLILELLDTDGNVIDWQREEEQIGAGETQPRLTSVPLFNKVCGGCHHALNGSELDVIADPDVTTGASNRSDAAKANPLDLYTDPSTRPVAAMPP